jgi:hypothetical protein
VAVAAENLPDLPPNVRPSDRPIVVYEQAVYAIKQCSTILEAKHWNDKAEALAAWAKIYADERVEQEARALKLHAFRQIGRLADNMRQWTSLGQGRGSSKGAHSLLQEHGFNKTRATEALRIGRAPETVFNALVGRKRPPSPSTAASQHLRPNPEWASFSHRLAMLLSGARKVDFVALVASLSPKQREAAKAQAKEAMDELGELLEQLWLTDPVRANANGNGAV